MKSVVTFEQGLRSREPASGSSFVLLHVFHDLSGIKGPGTRGSCMVCTSEF